MVYPKFTGKSDAYLWFIVHATRFLKAGGRLSFVVSSAILFSDYGIPLIRFLGRHFRIKGIAESMVERWFPEADTNTVLLFLEREPDAAVRAANYIRFIRLRRPLAQMLPAPHSVDRRAEVEALVDEMLQGGVIANNPRMQINQVLQGQNGGLTMAQVAQGEDLLEEGEDA